MKYTRYDLKRKRNNMAAIGAVFAITLILAFVFGSVISNIFIKNSNIKSSLKGLDSNPGSEVKQVDSIKAANFVVIQGGLFQNKQYVEEERSLLAQYGNPFIIEEEKGNRVLLGIFSENDGQNVIKTLKDKGVANSKITFQVDNSDLCNAEISGILAASIQVLTELAKKDVTSIQTEELKKWTTDLKEVEKNSVNFAVLQDLKGYIYNLPKEIGKDKASENYVFLYNTLKKISSKLN